MTVFCSQEASRILHPNPCWPVVTDGVAMFLDLSLDMLLTPTAPPAGDIERSRGIGNGRQSPDRTLFCYAKRLGMIALILAFGGTTRDSIAQKANGSIDVPPHSKLLLQAFGSGDQVTAA